MADTNVRADAPPPKTIPADEVQPSDISTEGDQKSVLKSLMLNLLPNIDIEITGQDVQPNYLSSDIMEKSNFDEAFVRSKDDGEGGDYLELSEWKAKDTESKDNPVAKISDNELESMESCDPGVETSSMSANDLNENDSDAARVNSVDVDMDAEGEDEVGSLTESALVIKRNPKFGDGNGDNQDEGDSRQSLNKESFGVEIEEPVTRKLFYRISENPPLFSTLTYALQQLLTSFSRTLTVSMLVAELVCGLEDQTLKTRLLATTALCNGLSTILVSTLGVRLPIYQGPAGAYIVPLIAMMDLREFSCPDKHSFVSGAVNGSNASNSSYYDEVTAKRLQMLSGSLIVAGAFQTIVGMTGLMGLLLRFVGPITIVPTLTIVGLYLYRAVTKFMSTHWGIGGLTSVVGVVCALYLRNVTLPLPWWSRKKGFHLLKSYFHRSLAILIALGTGWIFSAILTVAGAMSDDPNSKQYLARTDSQLNVISDTAWFLFPYPGQFGTPSLNAAIVVSFILASIAAILDSVGDYYACSRACFVPPPPAAAVSRGIMMEGIMSAFAGACGIGHATTSFGGNIGVISITKVASRRVFVVLGCIYIFFALFGKLGAIFVTIPLAVLGGVQLISFGIFVGVILSNLQYIDLRSTRNLAIMGLSMIIGMVFPTWAAQNPDGLDTGIKDLTTVLKMLLANPFFACGIMSCFLDNTVPGTLEERGLIAWLVDDATLQSEDEEGSKGVSSDLEEGKEVYDLPFLPYALRWGKIAKFIPIMPGYSFASGKSSVLQTLKQKMAKAN